MVLIFASCTTIGSYYVYDTPSALYTQLQNELMFYNEAVSSATFELYFNLLYSLYSIPNILLPFLGGHLVDTIGMRACIVLFASLVLVGQLITAIGCQMHSMAIMLIGRLIFGLGGECLVVGQSAFIAAWFHGNEVAFALGFILSFYRLGSGKEVAFALGFILSVSRFGSVANDWVSPIMANKYGVDIAFWFGTVLCLLSMLMAFVLAHLDRNHRAEVTRQNIGAADKESQAVGGQHQALHGSYFETPDPSLHGGSFTAPIQPVASDSNLQAQIEQQKAEIAHLQAELSGMAEDGLFHLMGFDSMFWLLATICTLAYGAIMPFNNMAQVYLLKHYIKIGTPPPDDVDCGFRPLLPEWQDYCSEVDKATEKAGSLQSVPFICAAILAPIIGIVIDRFGQRTTFIIVGPILLLITHIILLARGTDPLVPLIGLGLAYSIIVAVIWPSVPLTVHDNASSHRCGTAFGILTVFQNLSMALIPMAVTALHEVSHDYTLGEWFFILVSVGAVIAAIYLFKEDEAHGAILRRHVVDDHLDDFEEEGEEGEDDGWGNAEAVDGRANDERQPLAAGGGGNGGRGKEYYSSL